MFIQRISLKGFEIEGKLTLRHSLIFPGARDSNYNEFLTDIMVGGPDDCRYGLYDFEYQHQCEGTTDTTKKEKLVLMSWCPDTAKIKKKMLYSSSFDALKKCLVGVQKYIQVSGITCCSISMSGGLWKTYVEIRIFWISHWGRKT